MNLRIYIFGEFYTKSHVNSLFITQQQNKMFENSTCIFLFEILYMSVWIVDLAFAKVNIFQLNTIEMKYLFII